MRVELADPSGLTQTASGNARVMTNDDTPEPEAVAPEEEPEAIRPSATGLVIPEGDDAPEDADGG